MQDSDRARFTTALLAVAKAYRYEADEAWLGVYWLVLRGLTLAQLESACASCLKSEKFLPTPAVILAAATGTAADAASLAWESVRNQIRTVGYIGVPSLDELSARIVRALGGWERLCSCESTELDFVGKDFRTMYADRAGRPEVYGARAIAGVATKQIVGVKAP